MFQVNQGFLESVNDEVRATLLAMSENKDHKTQVYTYEGISGFYVLETISEVVIGFCYGFGAIKQYRRGVMVRTVHDLEK